ncbi:MAG TPA: hypothetical protein VMY42_11455 [Thermoguttaceae bacterium]|nr:hypothetical protein [Thermoguttaceae bacterium]
MVICCGVLLAIVAAGLGLLWALQRVPESYRLALKVERKDSEEMVRRTTALISDVEKEGPWSTKFTAEQINGGLAFWLAENYPDALPGAFRDPRVVIEPDRMLLFCKVEYGGVASVVTLTIEPYLPERRNILALRICGVRAGALPWPLGKIIDGVSELARQVDIQLDWKRTEGDPVALITIRPPADQPDKVVQIDSIELGEGHIYLGGTTRRRQETTPRSLP